MKKILILILFISTSSSAIVTDLYNLTMSIKDRADRIEQQERVKYKTINATILKNKTCEAAVLISKNKFDIKSKIIIKKLHTINDKANFYNIYLATQNNLYKKLILCNKTAIIGIKNQIKL